MKKSLWLVVSGLSLASSVVWAAPPVLTGTRLITAAGTHPVAVQTGAAAIAARPAAQARMDAAMAANPQAAALMNAVQAAAGVTPAR